MNVPQIQSILPDIPRFYTALAEWLACVLCILEMKPRFSKRKMAVTALGMLVVQTAFLELTGGLKGFWWMACMAAAIGLMYFFIYSCCNVSPKDAGYLCVRAFVVAEFAASLEWQMDCYFKYTRNWQSEWLGVFWLVLIYGLVYSLTWAVFHRYVKSKEDLMITNRELASYVIIGAAVFLISNVGFVNLNTPFSGSYGTEVFNVRTLIDLGGVAILYAYHVQRTELRVRHELESVQNILQSQYAQYKQSEEAMEIINYKYHDLKHHIIALRAEDNAERRSDYLDKMEEEIKTFEAQNNTGNQVLDTLITSKNLYCMKNDISMTCVVDGALFSFMDAMDICSIFGNALDNAIEYEKKTSEKEKRLIHVSAYSQKNFLIIRFENYCEEHMKIENELPFTTKADARFHGYGLKSIRYTARKYGGEVSVGVQDNWFDLRILIPLEPSLH